MCGESVELCCGACAWACPLSAPWYAYPSKAEAGRCTVRAWTSSWSVEPAALPVPRPRRGESSLAVVVAGAEGSSDGGAGGRRRCLGAVVVDEGEEDTDEALETGREGTGVVDARACAAGARYVSPECVSASRLCVMCSSCSSCEEEEGVGGVEGAADAEPLRGVAEDTERVCMRVALPRAGEGSQS